MVTFSELIGELGPHEVWGHPGGEVVALSWDSRRVRPGDLFFALPGTRADGHGFIPQAIERGAVGVVGERSLAGLSVPYIRVENARASLARAACAFFGHPTRLLKTVGVTGTNGKTTVVHLLGQLLPNCETLTTVRVEEEGLSCVTTPEAPDLQRIAAQALAQGKEFFAFEASSIGLAQHRVDGVFLSAAVFTGLSQDHLDFHGSMEAYLAAKLRLFEMLPQSGTPVINGEDPHAQAFLETLGQPLTYGIGQGDVRALEVQKEGYGTRFLLVTPEGRAEVFLPFPGCHNVENALAAAAVAAHFGLSPAEIAERLSRSTLPLGRFTRLCSQSGALVVVDFAHCPDSLGRMLVELRPLAQRLTCVFGCPGDSDRGKRPLMGEVAGRLADFSIVTSDNPKSEDPAVIAGEIVQGIRRASGHFRIELDRAVAIREAVEEAGPKDVVLIAGKGHERFQWTATGPLPHSDLGVLLSEGLRPLTVIRKP